MFTPDPKIFERLPVAISALGLTVLCFLLGAATVTFELFPYHVFFRPTFESIEATERAWTAPKDRDTVFDTHLWSRAEDPSRGVVSRKEKALLGYTFYSSAHLAGGMLVDMQGQTVHRWEAPFDDVWEEPPHVDEPAAADYVYWEDVELFPNGHLLAVYAAAGERPRGYGLAKISPDSEVEWKAPIRAHDDVSVAPDGTVHVLAHQYVSPEDLEFAPLDGADNPLLMDSIVTLSKHGERLRRIRLGRAVADSPFASLLDDANLEAGAGPIAASSLAVAGREFAESLAFVEPGQLLVALAGLDALVVVDPGRGEVTWARTGPWEHPKGLDLRPDGDVVLLETAGDSGVAGSSRVIRYDPTTESVDWSYGGSPSKPLSTSRHGLQRCLSNGNLLVTDSDSGRIVELVPGGGIVWSYVNPIRTKRRGESYRPAVFAADRLRRSVIDFELSSR